MRRKTRIIEEVAQLILQEVVTTQTEARRGGIALAFLERRIWDLEASGPEHLYPNQQSLDCLVKCLSSSQLDYRPRTHILYEAIFFCQPVTHEERREFRSWLRDGNCNACACWLVSATTCQPSRRRRKWRNTYTRTSIARLHNFRCKLNLSSEETNKQWVSSSHRRWPTLSCSTSLCTTSFTAS